MTLDIKRVLNSVDLRNYEFYENLTDDEKKDFKPYVLLRYVSNVSGDEELQEWFLERTNELVNKNYWTLSKSHAGLVWKLYAACGIGNKLFHPYLKASPKAKTDKFEKLLMTLYPAMKLDDISLMAKMMTKTQRNELFDQAGIDKKQRKEYE
jgi:hypothetical protein